MTQWDATRTEAAGPALGSTPAEPVSATIVVGGWVAAALELCFDAPSTKPRLQRYICGVFPNQSRDLAALVAVTAYSRRPNQCWAGREPRRCVVFVGNSEVYA
jgi:hypothetical protein